jgi:hypothetical protein
MFHTGINQESKQCHLSQYIIGPLNYLDDLRAISDTFHSV